MTGYADKIAPFGWPSRRGTPPGRRSIPIDGRVAPPHRLYYGGSAQMTGEAAGRVSDLTDAQRACLRLVYAHMTSKDIARALGVSPHTVDMRLRTAMKTLGVASRVEAARAFVEAVGVGDATYQPLIYQTPEVAAAASIGTLRAPVLTTSDEYATQHSDPRFSSDFGAFPGGPPRPADAPLTIGGDTLIAIGRHGERDDPVPLAFSLPWGEHNTLAPGVRVAWIAVIAIGSALGFGAVLGALAALTKLL